MNNTHVHSCICAGTVMCSNPQSTTTVEYISFGSVCQKFQETQRVRDAILQKTPRNLPWKSVNGWHVISWKLPPCFLMVYFWARFLFDGLLLGGGNHSLFTRVYNNFFRCRVLQSQFWTFINPSSLDLEALKSLHTLGSRLHVWSLEIFVLGRFVVHTSWHWKFFMRTLRRNPKCYFVYLNSWLPCWFTRHFIWTPVQTVECWSFNFNFVLLTWFASPLTFRLVRLCAHPRFCSRDMSATNDNSNWIWFCCINVGSFA